MQIQITGHKVDITPALRAYATEKLDRLKKRDGHITSINLILDVEKVEQIAKATIHASGVEYHAKSSSGDLYSAIDLLIDKLSHQLTKHKEKVKNHQADGVHNLGAQTSDEEESEE